MGVNMVLCKLHVLFRSGILFINKCLDKVSPYVVVLNQHINTSHFIELDMCTVTDQGCVCIFYIYGLT